MQKRIAYVIAGAAVLSGAPLAYAQVVAWRIVAGESGTVVSPGLPAGVGRTLTDITLGDVGADLVGLRITNQSTLTGYWARKQGTLVRYTQAGVTGNLGPGRTGTQSTHVFTDVGGGWRGASPDGQRVFAAQAGPPGSPTAATDGIWR